VNNPDFCLIRKLDAVSRAAGTSNFRGEEKVYQTTKFTYEKKNENMAKKSAVIEN